MERTSAAASCLVPVTAPQIFSIAQHSSSRHRPSGAHGEDEDGRRGGLELALNGGSFQKSLALILLTPNRRALVYRTPTARTTNTKKQPCELQVALNGKIETMCFLLPGLFILFLGTCGCAARKCMVAMLPAPGAVLCYSRRQAWFVVRVAWLRSRQYLLADLKRTGASSKSLASLLQ